MSSLENNAIYLTLNVRGIPGSYHWGIFVPLAAPMGKFYHATNRVGGWTMEVKNTTKILTSTSLAVMCKVAQVPSSQLARIDEILYSLPADGRQSARTGEDFNCRTWVKDAIVALHDGSVIALEKTIDTIEHEAVQKALLVEPRIEHGTSAPIIIDSSSSSK
ncbi:MAG: hypothetical protein M1834_008444 [Cirrosporium novae-zelandiae]|nr:MAG: hypothetical protein M1834_008444 [Cirrosporium novae-zelandiae]